MKAAAAPLLALAAAAVEATADQTAPPPTFTKDVAPILYDHCAVCHRPGQIGPFPLVTYEDAARRSRQIKAVTGRRQMPPWHAVDTDHPLQGDRRLTEKEILTLAQWSENGRPKGDPADLPPLPKFPESWILGEPDLVVEIPESAIPADGEDIFVDAVVKIPVEGKRWISAVELLPGNPAVVHHAAIIVDRTGALSEQIDNPRRTEGVMPALATTAPLDIFLGFLPGTKPHQLPEGYGVPVTPGANLLLRFHYHPTGKPEKDASKVGLYFSETANRETFLLNFGIFKQGQELSRLLDIPAGKKDHRIKFGAPLWAGGKLHTVQPHGHYIMREFDLIARPPGKEPQTVLSIRGWDFNWQDRYEFKDPPFFPGGTKFEIVALFDNSADNPQNPSDPPIPVRAGPQSEDEMCGAWLFFLPAHQNFVKIPENGLPIPDHAAKLKKMDADADGKLDPEEFESAPERLKHLVTGLAEQGLLKIPTSAGGTFRLPPGGLPIPSQMKMLRQRLDADEDGRLTEEELSTAPANIQKRAREFFRKQASTEAKKPEKKQNGEDPPLDPDRGESRN